MRGWDNKTKCEPQMESTRSVQSSRATSKSVSGVVKSGDKRQGRLRASFEESTEPEQYTWWQRSPPLYRCGCVAICWDACWCLTNWALVWSAFPQGSNCGSIGVYWGPLMYLAANRCFVGHREELGCGSHTHKLWRQSWNTQSLMSTSKLCCGGAQGPLALKTTHCPSGKNTCHGIRGSFWLWGCLGDVFLSSWEWQSLLAK